MNKLYLKCLIGLFFFCGALTVLSQEKINNYDENGKRTGVWVKYYPNNNIRYQGQFEAGKEVGVFKFYSMVNSKHPIIIKTFSTDTDIAKVVFYTEDGVMKSQGEMKKELRVGKWLYYQKNGKTIISEENYSNGLLDGIAKTYYITGKTTEILFYKNGKLHGDIQRFSDQGVLLDDLKYVDGKLEGLAHYYNTFGKLNATGRYKNGEKIGDWEYFENGEKVSKKSEKY